MAHILCLLPLSPGSPASSSNWQPSLPSLPKIRFASTATGCMASAASQIGPEFDQRPRFKEFPYAAAPIRDVMVELVSTVEKRLESHLLPCTLPPDVHYYQNQSGTAHASLFIRTGAPSSSIDFILGTWLHSELPAGGAVNITNLVSYMNDTTDTPSLVIEFIQSSPTSLVLILDLPHRKDLVIHPEYIKTFYEDTDVDKQRQLLYQIPEIQPYYTPSLYLRCIWSPTSIFARIDTTGSGGEARLEEILRDNVSAAAKKLLDIWLDLCTSGKGRDLDDEEKAYLRKRDHISKSKSIEIDLGSSLPRLFGQETADRVLGVLRSL